MRQKKNAADAASTTILQWNRAPCLSDMVCTMDLTKHSSIRDSGRRRSASGACQAEATVTTIRVRRLVRKAGAMIVGRVAELPTDLSPFSNGRRELCHCQCAVNWGRLRSLRSEYPPSEIQNHAGRKVPLRGW